MTCIVGFINSKSKKMTLIADSRSSNSYGFYSDKNEFRDKVFKKNDMIVGCSGASLLNQVIKYNCKFPPLVENQDPKEYLATAFIPAIKRAVEDHNVTRKNGDNKAMNGTLLVGFRGHIYVISSDYLISETPDEFTVIGSGSLIALGSLFTSEVKDQKDKAEFAIKLASKYLNNVGGEIVEVSTDY